MFYIKAISMMYKDSFSVFFGFFVGFTLIFLVPLIYVLPEFYIDSVKHIVISSGNLFFGEKNSKNGEFYNYLIFLTCLSPIIILASLIISRIGVKLYLVSKKIILSIIVMPCLCYAIALFFKINGNKTDYLYTSIDGSVAMSYSSRPSPLWEKYLDLGFFEVHIGIVFLFSLFFIIFNKVMRISKHSIEINA